MLHLELILHPTDFSEHSTYAFRLACSLARDHGARLLLLHVMPSPVVYGEMGPVLHTEEYQQLLWDNLHKLQPADPTIRVEHRLEEGNAAATITRVAADTHCDLIVMGTHGRSGLGRLFLGSVAEKVMRKATCPVLTVKSALPETLEDSSPQLVPEAEAHAR
jgi:nucleotide-binding universal stress UspA family protein